MYVPITFDVSRTQKMIDPSPSQPHGTDLKDLFN